MRFVTKERPHAPSKVELYAAIRRDACAGMSGRAIGKKYRVGRRTIVKALSSAWPEPRKQLPPRASKLDPFKPVIDEILKADLDAPRKQRHTITRIWHRLMDEHGMADGSYPMVRAYVAERKPQIRAEAGPRAGRGVRSAADQEVDTAEVTVAHPASQDRSSGSISTSYSPQQLLADYLSSARLSVGQLPTMPGRCVGDQDPRAT